MYSRQTGLKCVGHHVWEYKLGQDLKGVWLQITYDIFTGLEVFYERF